LKYFGLRGAAFPIDGGLAPGRAARQNQAGRQEKNATAHDTMWPLSSTSPPETSPLNWRAERDAQHGQAPEQVADQEFSEIDCAHAVPPDSVWADNTRLLGRPFRERHVGDDVAGGDSARRRVPGRQRIRGRTQGPGAPSQKGGMGRSGDEGGDVPASLPQDDGRASGLESRSARWENARHKLAPAAFAVSRRPHPRP